MVIRRDTLAREFVDLVQKYHPRASKVLDFCHVKIIDCYIKRLGKSLSYLGVYYPEGLKTTIQKHEPAFQEIAENMGLLEVVFINATRLVRDPKSRLKHENPRFWLELYWIATHHLS